MEFEPPDREHLDRAPLDPELARLLREKSWPALHAAVQVDIERARKAGNPELQARLLDLLALACSVLGDPTGAVQAAQKALDLRRALRDAIGIAQAISGLAAATASSAGVRAAMDLFREAFNAQTVLDDLVARCCAAMTFAQLLTRLDNLPEAHRVIDQALAWCPEDALAWCQWSLLEIKAAAHREGCGRKAAVKCLEAAFLLRQREGAITWECLNDLGNLYLHQDRTWEAREMFRMAFEMAKEGYENYTLDLSQNLKAFLRIQFLRPRRLTDPSLKLPGGRCH